MNSLPRDSPGCSEARFVHQAVLKLTEICLPLPEIEGFSYLSAGIEGVPCHTQLWP